MSAMEIDPPIAAGVNTSGGAAELVTAQFDLESYAKQYSGHARVNRLVFIARNPEQKELAIEAARMALNLLKETMNSSLYGEVAELYSKLTGEEVPGVEEHCHKVDSQASAVREKLEVELTGYKTNLIKESIRMGHTDLGDFFYERGLLNEALQSYVRSRDYCTASKHMIQMCLNVIKVSIEIENFPYVNNYVGKAELTPDIQDDPVTAAKLKVAAGLAALNTGDYRGAARLFVQVSPELDTQYNHVVAPQDIVLYGGLCSLAAMDRETLREQVINNATFRSLLEVTPDVRDLVNSFYQSNYTDCMRYIDKLKADVSIDLYMAKHSNKIFTMIRNKALVQYFSPFSSVNLVEMAVAFNTDPHSLEQDLSRLIVEKQLSGRIDTQNKVLYANRTDPRRETFRMAVACSDTFTRRTRSALLRVNLLRNDISVRARGDGMSAATSGSSKTGARGHPRGDIPALARGK